MDRWRHFNYQDIEMNFENLPEDMKAFLPGKQTHYTFKYCDYVAYGGYAYNFVLKPRKWLINVMGVLGSGLSSRLFAVKCREQKHVCP